MATPTRPCPYCGAAVLMNAPACGTCGRPMPPMQQGAPGSQPAKTMFGYAAPVIPGRPAGQPAAQPQRPAAQPAQPAGFPQAPAPQQPAQPAGFPPAQAGASQQNPYAQQPAQQPGNPYGQPQAANPYAQQQGGNPYGQPGIPQANHPYAQPAMPQAGNPYGQPQAGSPYGQPQAANPYGQPGMPQGNPYGQPGMAQGNPYGQPGVPQGNPYGQPGMPQGNPYGQQAGYPQQGYPQQGYAQQAYPQQGYAQQGYPQQGGYPQAASPYAQAQPGASGLGELVNKLPQSAPGTIFGIPVARLRDPGLQKKILFLAGVALVASVVVPVSIDPLIFPWKLGGFSGFVWPLLSGLAYLLLTAAPAEMRAKVPPVVLQWIPFAVAYAGIFISHMGGLGVGSLYILGYSILVFGLLARIAQPQDQIARIVVAVGAACLIPSWIDSFHLFGGLGAFPILVIVSLLLGFIVLTIAVLCIVFVVPQAKLPPALQTVDALGPLVAAVLILWLPVVQVLVALAIIVHQHAPLRAVLALGHGVLPILAYFGVLMMASPAAYEEAKAMFGKRTQPPGGGGYPPGGGYSPPGGGYPPQQGGYSPPGGGYPPQQGGWQ